MNEKKIGFGDVSERGFGDVSERGFGDVREPSMGEGSMNEWLDEEWEMDSWRICESISVVQAALLVIDENPDNFGHISSWEEHNRPPRFSAVFTGIKNAILNSNLEATFQNGVPEILSDWENVNVSVDKLKCWLKSRGFKSGFFFSKKDELPDYLNKKNSTYAPKLAAAVYAWQAVNNDKALMSGKTPKQAIVKWVKEHATEFGLTNDDGKLNETGIEEISKVANWQSKGGAAKTPEPPHS